MGEEALPAAFVGSAGRAVSLVYDPGESGFRGVDRQSLPVWVREGLSDVVRRVCGAADTAPEELRWEAFARELATHGHVVMETPLERPSEGAARIEVSLSLTGGNALLVRARDVSRRARLLADVNAAIERIEDAAEVLNGGVAIQDATGMCRFASARLLAMAERNAGDLPLRTESFFDPGSWPEVARQMQKRRFGIMTPYRALVRAGRSRIGVLVSPVPIFAGEGVFRGSLETFVEDAGESGAAQALERYRDQVESVVRSGNELVVQLDRLTAGEQHQRGGDAGTRARARRSARGGSARAIALLTPKEREIAERLTKGMRVAEIAVALAISVSTVRNHLKSVFRKLGVGSQLELVTLLTR